MEKKVCNECNLEKYINEYHKRQNGKYGRFAICKECRKKISQRKWANNENNIQEKHKDYVKNHKEQKLDTQKKYRENNKEKLSISRKIYYQKNKEKESRRVMEYYYNNKDYVVRRNINYNKDKLNEDSFFKLKTYVRNRIKKFLTLKNITKKNKTFDIVGCLPEQLKEHIEKQFTEGMCWEKMGKYIHIDHIIPLSSAKTEEEILKLCHYTNLQPLWAEENLKKKDKIIY
jgi:hypothetical protein